MKVVLFCGGRGTRIREYSESVPKPLIPLLDTTILTNAHGETRVGHHI